MNRSLLLISVTAALLASAACSRQEAVGSRSAEEPAATEQSPYGTAEGTTTDEGTATESMPGTPNADGSVTNSDGSVTYPDGTTTAPSADMPQSTPPDAIPPGTTADDATSPTQ